MASRETMRVSVGQGLFSNTSIQTANNAQELFLKAALVDKDPNVSLPQFTSCSPGWVKYLEHFYPEYIPNVSSAKSPQQMFGALIKTYYAELNHLDPKDIVTVALMPCSA